MRGTGRRKKFLTLQSAREDFEHHLQALVSVAANALAQQQQQQQQQQQNGDSLQRVSAATVRLLETSREDGLAKPPFDILRDMYRGIDEVARALASLSAGEKAGEGAGRGGNGGGSSGPPCAAGMTESCGAAKEALDAIREAVGADIASDLGERETVAGTALSSTDRRHHQSQPVGSGRAAAVAMSSGRGGMLVSPEESSAAYPERPAPCTDKDTGKGGGRTGSGGEKRHVHPVPLRTLDVKSVAELLRASGFEEHCPGFVAQGIDGVMLSDPNLCEADFAELGIGGGREGEGEGGRDSRARMVSLFRQCQQKGVLFPAHNGGSPPHPVAVGAGHWSGDRRSGDFSPDKRRREDPTPGSTDESGSLRSPEETSWRRGSVLVDRENQRVLAQITLDEPGEMGRSGAAASSGQKGNGRRRMSVKLNNGVVVTAGGGGREEGLVDNADGPFVIDADAEAAAAEVEGEDEALTGTSGDGGASRAGPHGRRSSIGLRTIPLYKEPGRAGEGSDSHTVEDLPLPPGVAITTSDEAVNVFR